MKNRVLATLLAGVLAIGLLAGCGSKDEAADQTEAAEVADDAEEDAADEEADDEAADDAEADEDADAADDDAEEADAAEGDLEVIRIGATPSPHAEILEEVNKYIEAEGYTLDIVEFTDYVQPNEALDSGDLDANYFQHLPYLETFNEERNLTLVSAGSIHYEPFGIYAGKTDSLDDLEDGASVAVPNDGSNEARALLLLEAQGLIKLADGVGVEATVTDIVENEKNLDIKEIEAAQIPRSLQDVDIAVINGNYALEAGLHASKDALVTEDSESVGATTYGNVVAVRDGDENTDAIQALIKVLESDEIKTFIEDTYEGAVVPLF